MTRKIKLTYFLGALFFSTVVLSEPVLVLNTALQYPFNNEKQTGFLDRVVKEALSRMGFRLETMRLPAERALKNVNLGIDDGDMFRVKGLESIYPNIVRVPEKLLDMQFTAFSRKTFDLSQGWKSLQGLSVGYINGWKILEENISNDVDVTTVRDSGQLFKLLKKRRVELIIYERWGAELIIKSMGLAIVKRQEPALIVTEMFIYLHKKHRMLVPILAATIKQLKQEGFYQELASDMQLPWDRQKRP